VVSVWAAWLHTTWETGIAAPAGRWANLCGILGALWGINRKNSRLPVVLPVLESQVSLTEVLVWAGMTLRPTDRGGNLARAGRLKRSTHSAETGMQQGSCGKAGVWFGEQPQGTVLGVVIGWPRVGGGGPLGRPPHPHAKTRRRASIDLDHGQLEGDFVRRVRSSLVDAVRCRWMCMNPCWYPSLSVCRLLAASSPRSPGSCIKTWGDARTVPKILPFAGWDGIRQWYPAAPVPLWRVRTGLQISGPDVDTK
jgi:hypothetical protein